MALGYLRVKIIEHELESLRGDHAIANGVVGKNLRYRTLVLLIGVRVFAVQVVNDLADLQPAFEAGRAITTETSCFTVLDLPVRVMPNTAVRRARKSTAFK